MSALAAFVRWGEAVNHRVGEWVKWLTLATVLICATVVFIRYALQAGLIWLQDLYDTPAYDIALRGGDKIIVEQDRRAFTALGATEQQARVNFTKPNMSAIEAIAAAGGLDGDAADPTGIFVFRSERADVASRVLGGVAVSGPQRMAYVMNLTEPEGMFAAREFTIRDEDTVYITEAPFKAWRQIIGLTATTVALGGSVAAIASR